MKNKLLMLVIVVGVISLCTFPALAIFSLLNIQTSKDDQKVMTIETVKNNKIITGKKKAIINMDNIFTLQGESIDDETIPLGQIDEDIKTVDGKQVRNDFKGHEKEIIKGDIVFEIIDKNGHNLFFINYDELDLMINDKTKYQKQFVLNDDNKLVRYVYLELQ